MIVCDKMLDAGTRRCTAVATLFYQSETIRQIAARCTVHQVVPYKPELGRLLHLTEQEFLCEYAKLKNVVRSPVEILEEAAFLLEKTGFTADACAVDRNGRRLADVEIEADRFCVSGAARAVAFRGHDGDESPQEKVYVEAMDMFCRFVGTATVMEWADYPGRSTDDAVRALRGAAAMLRQP